MSRSHIFLSHVCKIFVVYKDSFGCRVFFKTFFLERLFVNPPLWQRWLTSVLPLGYFYLLGRSFVLQGWWNHLKEEREKSLLEQTPTFCYRFCLRQSFFFPEVCYWSPCVCLFMSGFGVHHDRCGGSARLDGEALRWASAVHTCPSGRTGTFLLQLVTKTFVIHQHIKGVNSCL